MRRAAAAVCAALLLVPAAAHAAQPPVVVVVFDALPPLLLQTPGREIDAVRFPNFARFAEDGTWFRNATTIHESTRYSVPAILDGRQPFPSQHETLASHPVNLFTLLGNAGWSMNVWEEATHMCPPSLCVQRQGANVIGRLARGRAQRFRKALSLVRGGRPQLTFIHAFLPHEPRQYLPDGSRYQLGRSRELSVDGAGSYHRRYLTEQALQRTILQLRFTDRVLGDLVKRLKDAGVWNDALVMLVSDHGESFDIKRTPAGAFKVGQLSFHRAVTRQNIEDIAGMAMFVKWPGQQRGGSDPRFVRSADVLPTVLSAAGIQRPGGLIGEDLRSDEYKGHADVAVQKQDGRVIAMPRERWSARAEDSLKHRISLFGFGGGSVFGFGPAKDLNGEAVAGLTVLPHGRVRAVVDRVRDYGSVRPSSGYIPAHVMGRITGGSPGGRTLVFALNGVVAGSAPSYSSLGKFNFAVLLPPDAFKGGRNRLEIFELLPDDRLRRLR